MNDKWARNKPGLFVPEGDHVSSGPDRAESTWRSKLRAIRKRSWATFAATAISVLSLLLAYLAYDSQKGANLEQANLTERRYADRVTWWDEISDDGSVTVHFENRATVSLYKVLVGGGYYLEGKGDGVDMQAILLGSIPPCTSASIPFKSRPDKRTWNTNYTMFRDPVKDWLKEGSRAMIKEYTLTPMTGLHDPDGILSQAGPRSYDTKAVSDCGP